MRGNQRLDRFQESFFGLDPAIDVGKQASDDLIECLDNFTKLIASLEIKRACLSILGKRFERLRQSCQRRDHHSTH